jgi:hypothetical protein
MAADPKRDGFNLVGNRCSVFVMRSLEPEARPDPLRGTGPWWEALDPEFHRSDERFVLGPLDRAAVAAAAAGDVAIRTLGASLVGAFALPSGFRPAAIGRAIDEERLYTAAVDDGDPGLFFRPPPGGVRVMRHRPLPPHFPARGGTCEDLRFESPFEPASPSERGPYLAHRRNRTAHARFWRHHGAPRPALVAIHGFSADPYWLNEWFFDLPSFYRMGFDVLLVTLPFHGRRREPLAPFSGHGFFAGLQRMNEAFAQTVHDLRVFDRFLRADHGSPAVGVTGVSLGGYTAALYAALEPGLAFSVPNVPLVSVADLVLEWRPLGPVVRALLRRSGRRLADVRRFLAVHSPLTWPAAIPRERLMVIGGAGDRMAPPKHARLLWDHWGRPRVHWFRGSHLLHLDRRDYQARLRELLADAGLSGGPRSR